MQMNPAACLCLRVTVAEELRFFLRVGLFGALISAIYWFVSYEIAGTILLAFLTVAAAIFIGTTGTFVPSARRGVFAGTKRGFGRFLEPAERLLGFEEDSEATRSDALEVVEDPVAHSSVWPFVAALAGTSIAFGLVFGPWFWIPGIAVALASAWGWLTQLQ